MAMEIRDVMCTGTIQPVDRLLGKHPFRRILNACIQKNNSCKPVVWIHC